MKHPPSGPSTQQAEELYLRELKAVEAHLLAQTCLRSFGVLIDEIIIGTQCRASGKSPRQQTRQEVSSLYSCMMLHVFFARFYRVFFRDL